jgi:hypothetical protein
MSHDIEDGDSSKLRLAIQAFFDERRRQEAAFEKFTATIPKAVNEGLKEISEEQSLVLGSLITGLIAEIWEPYKDMPVTDLPLDEISATLFYLWSDYWFDEKGEKYKKTIRTKISILRLENSFFMTKEQTDHIAEDIWMDAGFRTEKRLFRMHLRRKGVSEVIIDELYPNQPEDREQRLLRAIEDPARALEDALFYQKKPPARPKTVSLEKERPRLEP